MRACLLTPRPPHCPPPPPQLEEESLRDNFVIAYELLDEVCDFGYMQVSTLPTCMQASCRTSRSVCCCSQGVPALVSAVPCCLSTAPHLQVSRTVTLLTLEECRWQTMLPGVQAGRFYSSHAPARTCCCPHAPQFTEAKILSEFIKTDAHRLAVQARPPMAVTNAVSWRQEGLFYKKNEVGREPWLCCFPMPLQPASTPLLRHLLLPTPRAYPLPQHLLLSSLLTVCRFVPLHLRRCSWTWLRA